MIGRLKRRIWLRFLRTLGRDEPAWEVALSFAVGVAISFSPLLGLHALIALAIAWLFRLNKIDVVLGTLVFVNPWTMVPIYSSATALGWFLLGHDASATPRIPWQELLHPITLFETLQMGAARPYLTSLALGSAIYMLLSGLTTYAATVFLVTRIRRRRKLLRALRKRRRRGGPDAPADAA